MWRHSHASGRLAVQETNRHVGCGAAEFLDRQQPTADNSVAKHHGVFRKQGSVRGCVQVGEHAVVGIRPTLRVGDQGHVKDRRTAWQGGTAPHDLLNGQIVGPDERQPAVKSRELVFELSTPERAQRSRAHHHEDLPGLGKQLQNVIDQLREIVDDRDGRLVVPKGASRRYC